MAHIERCPTCKGSGWVRVVWARPGYGWLYASAATTQQVCVTVPGGWTGTFSMDQWGNLEQRDPTCKQVIPE